MSTNDCSVCALPDACYIREKKCFCSGCFDKTYGDGSAFEYESAEAAGIEDGEYVYETCCIECGESFRFDEPVSVEEYSNGKHAIHCEECCKAQDEEEEEEE